MVTFWLTTIATADEQKQEGLPKEPTTPIKSEDLATKPFAKAKKESSGVMPESTMKTSDSAIKDGPLPKKESSTVKPSAESKKEGSVTKPSTGQSILTTSASGVMPESTMKSSDSAIKDVSEPKKESSNVKPPAKGESTVVTPTTAKNLISGSYHGSLLVTTIAPADQQKQEGLPKEPTTPIKSEDLATRASAEAKKEPATPAKSEDLATKPFAKAKKESSGVMPESTMKTSDSAIKDVTEPKKASTESQKKSAAVTTITEEEKHVKKESSIQNEKMEAPPTLPSTEPKNEQSITKSTEQKSKDSLTKPPAKEKQPQENLLMNSLTPPKEVRAAAGGLSKPEETATMDPTASGPTQGGKKTTVTKFTEVKKEKSTTRCSVLDDLDVETGRAGSSRGTPVRRTTEERIVTTVHKKEKRVTTPIRAKGADSQTHVELEVVKHNKRTFTTTDELDVKTAIEEQQPKSAGGVQTK
ncbi:hypothetical protein OSTOST_04845 [Ostertagia ostertagi]